ncbi:MAG: VOC family protein [Candidatus Tectomicrobia bacterium]|uniref:VOC family protein n=1 Tax=Tectimicrobiota bacterium TaxID=2528274 RepID=A0A932HZH1_UNCTE|nr:VOC family protein [Candidatus Tectomicrobia bacterium]
MPLRYEHAHIVHRDHDAAVKFYQEVLGAGIKDSVLRYGAPQTKLLLGGTMFIVRGVRPGEAPPFPPAGLPRMGVDHLGFYVDKGEYDPMLRELRAKGVPILEEGDLPHLRYCYFGGPDGVVLEIMEMK